MPKNLINVKEDILSVTKELIKQTGYSDLSIRKIAAACGVATGTVYNYYSSKTEIIAEILLNEWNLMLRKIDLNTKSVSTALEKLEIMYNEINFFMTNVHGVWFQTYPLNSETTMDITRIKEKRKFLRNQLSVKIYSFIRSEKSQNDEVLNICDIISNILISYANDSTEFSKIKSSLSALVEKAGCLR